jgi:hypothetical protein
MPGPDRVPTRRPPWNVLVFPGGTEIGLEINRALRGCKEVRLLSAASDVPNHAGYFYRHHFVLPSIREPYCADRLRALVADHAIDFIFPANPLVMDFLDRHRDTLGCAVVMPSSDVLGTTRSKRETYRRLADVVPVPTVYDGAPDRFPVYLKPDRMYGAQGGRLIRSAAELALEARSPDDVVCEYLPGEEYTVDCFSTAAAGLLFAGPRTRDRIRMGTSMRSTAPTAAVARELRAHAQRLQQRLGMTGPWFFQMRRAADGTLKLLEVDPRIAGTMALHRVQGVNFALLALYERAGLAVSLDPQPIPEIEIDRALVNRYRHGLRYRTVYVDLDDTLICKDRLNLDVLRFLYQCVNEGKRLVLVSKSLAGDPPAVLRRWRIAGLFDEIHWLREPESKADYIRDRDAIYIDDSFSQRREVQQRCGIPTFDPSMVEILLDERGD